MRRELIPYVILALMLTLTAVAARYASRAAAREEQLRFRNTVDNVRGAIDSRLDAYVALLRGSAGLFTSSNQVSLDEFRAYVRRLELARYPGVQGVGYSRRIPARSLNTVLESMHAQGLHTFRYWPEHDRERHAILYLEPLDPMNRHALGFDMFSEPGRREAMERARDTGAPAATRKVRLVQEDAAQDEQAGFLIYVPVYFTPSIPPDVAQRRELLRGFVYSPFRTGDLFDAIRQSVPPDVTFDVYDGEPGDEQRLYRSAAAPPETPGWLQEQRRIEVAGQRWVLLFRPAGSMIPRHRRVLPILLLAGGTALSLLLFAVVRSQVRARKAAEQAASASRQSEEALRAADRAKDDFLATISHELRTPLNAIIGWAAILAREGVPEQTRTHALAVIGRNAAAQARLVEDLLDLSRAAAGHLSLRLGEIDAGATLEAAVDAVRPAAHEARLTLHHEIAGRLGTIEADAGRLQQIVTNLLSNAIKFTPAEGRVTLRAERTRESLIVTVTDTGIGIDQAFLPYLFDRFRQADASVTRAHAGAGLGLAIARHLVHLHGGTIEAASAGTGQGASFTVRVPVRRRQV